MRVKPRKVKNEKHKEAHVHREKKHRYKVHKGKPTYW